MAIEPLPTSDGRPAPDPDNVGAPLDRLLRRHGRAEQPHGGRPWRSAGSRWWGSPWRPTPGLLRVRDGVIVVAVDDPAWASELRWMGDTLAARAREVLGDAEHHRDRGPRAAARGLRPGPAEPPG